ncbi:hypothetical protein LCGC14_0188150 [marine sediment metagenome]|uniref:DUF7768 domain-containing protein n=1 Tax=marine sediment metagenome TaxID=412755 RepID=A0A0F9V447_9ZZZZ
MNDVGENKHPCMGLYHRPGVKSHRSYVFSDGRQHYCQRCGEKIDHKTFSNIPSDYVVTHDAGDYNLPIGKVMRLVIIESPYAGNVELNTRYARAAMRDCLEREEAPYASHLLYTQPDVLDDDNPDEQSAGIDAGLAWGEKADATVVYEDLGISEGMRLGIERAKRAGRRVEVRRLPVVVMDRIRLKSTHEVTITGRALVAKMVKTLADLGIPLHSGGIVKSNEFPVILSPGSSFPTDSEIAATVRQKGETFAAMAKEIKAPNRVSAPKLPDEETEEWLERMRMREPKFKTATFRAILNACDTCGTHQKTHVCNRNDCPRRRHGRMIP